MFGISLDPIISAMKKHNPIIAGIDFSDSSSVVLRHAIDAAGSADVTVIAVHVLEKGRQEYREASGQRKASFEVLKCQADDRFAELLSGKSNGAHVEFIVKQGEPVEELNLLAKNMEAAFLVLSANDLTKKRLGSVAAKCVRTAPCDVLILRDWQGGSFQKIVACTDFSATADRAIARAASLAKRHGASLEIINVMYPPDRDSWGEVLNHAADSPVTYEEACKASVRGKMEQCLKRCGSALDRVRYESIILESQMPSVAITEHVRSNGSDLVVMGTQGQSQLVSYFIGTNAERLIQDAPVSVFAVR